MNAIAKRFIPTWLAMRFERPTPRRLGSLAPVLHEVVERLEAVKPAVPARTDFHCEAPAMTPLPPAVVPSGRKRSTVLAKLLATDPQAIPRAEKALAIARESWVQTYLRLMPGAPAPARDPDELLRRRMDRRFALQMAPKETREVIETAREESKKRAPPSPPEAAHETVSPAPPEPSKAPPRSRPKPIPGAARNRSGGSRKAAPKRLRGSALEEFAKEYLVTRLAGETAPVLSGTLRKEWKRATGYSVRTLQRAAEDLGMVYTKMGIRQGWSLPTASPSSRT